MQAVGMPGLTDRSIDVVRDVVGRVFVCLSYYSYQRLGSGYHGPIPNFSTKKASFFRGLLLIHKGLKA
jgi:hypothetical protein